MQGVELSWQRLVACVMVGVVVAACAPASPGPTPASTAPGAESPPTGPPAAAVPATPATSSGSAPAGPPARVRTAYVSIASSVLPTWIAKDEGIYERYGLDVEMTYIAGLAKIAEALLANEIDFGITPAPTAFGPGLEGADLVMVACWSAKSAFSLYAQSSIQTVADLRGRRLGVSRRGSASELWASAVLTKFGLEPERDYAVLGMGGQPEQLAGLINGAIDAAVLGIPTNILARRQGLRELLHYRDNALEFSNVGLVTSRRYLREQPDVAERFMRATAEGVAAMMQDTEMALAVLGRYTRVDEREMLEESLAFERARTARDLVPTPEGLRAAMEELAENNPKAATANPQDFVDLTLVRRLNDSGFIPGLYR